MQPTNDNARVITVSEAQEGKLTQKIEVGNHTLYADEPIEVGGGDKGPSPYDFILAGLGACTSMTLRIYANFKHIPLKKVIVKLSYDKVYAQDCENCEDPHSKIDHIDRRIELQGELTQEQRQKLLDIANKCPVHRTLTSKILITTNLV